MSFLQKNWINIVTSIGIVLSILALWLLIAHKSDILFLIVLNIIVVIDACDGYLARKFDITSKLGSILDTINDILVYLAIPVTYILIQTRSELLYLLVCIGLILAGTIRLIRYTKEGIISKDGRQYTKGLSVFFILFCIPLFNLVAYEDNFVTFFGTIFLIYSIALMILMPGTKLIPRFTILSGIGTLILFNILQIITRWL